MKTYTYELDGIVVTDLRLVDADSCAMVGCTLVLDGVRYDCAEYFDDDGHIDDSADSHMTVNGIFNLQSGRMEPFISDGMERADYVRWTNAKNVVLGAMHVFVADHLFPPDIAAA